MTIFSTTPTVFYEGFFLQLVYVLAVAYKNKKVLMFHKFILVGNGDRDILLNSLASPGGLIGPRIIDHCSVPQGGFSANMSLLLVLPLPLLFARYFFLSLPPRWFLFLMLTIRYFFLILRNVCD